MSFFRPISQILVLRQSWFMLILGFGMALGQMPFDYPYLAFLSLIFLGILWIQNNCTGVEASVLGFILGSSYFTTTFFWIVEPFMVFPLETGWGAPFALLGLSGILSLIWAILFYFAAILGKGKGKCYRLLALWALISLSELIRSEWLADFPWGLISSIWINTPFGQALSIFGPYWLSSLTVFVAFLFAISWKTASVGLLLITLVYSFGESRLNSIIENRTDPIRVRLVQPNVKQAEKWKPEYAEKFLIHHIELSKKSDLSNIDLVIWPETAVSYLVEDDNKLRRIISEELEVPVLLGARRLTENKLFNSAFLLEKSGEIKNVYDKTNLVPFGEYIPFAKFLSKLGIFGLATDGIHGFSSGKARKVFGAEDFQAFLILICYEAIFPNMVDNLSPKVSWIVQITNDAWFGEFSGPQQHLTLARMRAVEQGLPLVRVANTGISALVDPYGRVQKEIPLGQEGHADVLVPKPLTFGFYSFVGGRVWNTILLTLLLLTITIFPIITTIQRGKKD